MSSLTLSAATAAGQAAYTAVQSAGAIAGAVAVAGLQGLASAAIARAFDNRHSEGRRLTDLHLQSSTEGAGIPIVYGRARVGGQVIWAARYKETSTTSGGGKGGGPTRTDYQYTASFAVALGEGEIDSIGRVWADGRPLALDGVTMRLYRGSTDQEPDPLIEAVEGVGDVPAFRGVAYVVFEDLPLDTFGNRVPQLNFEVYRSPAVAGDRLETMARGVTLIPGSGEFAYATSTVVRDLGPGLEQAENVNNTRGGADIVAALDDLQARFPNITSVMLVVSWFGDDLRCGSCRLRPGVESNNKVTRPYSWRVGDVERDSAYIVSNVDGVPNYGGTPADVSILEAIAEVKARGLKVALYPFILMDIPADNTLPDPHGASAQAAFPWRGRITCDPAPGQLGSPDKTAAAGAQVSAFFGAAAASDFSIASGSVSYTGPLEDSFQHFILHYAHLSVLAGGVDAFIMGSEMRGLTHVRDGAGSYPAVSALIALAGEVRTVIGPGVVLTYAADWSEYFGHQPADGSGDVYFHLDDLWADPNIDVVGVDWYAPIADWRDGSSHLDAASFSSIYDPAYLETQIEGGEGFDWYYASDADRDAQIRAPITDGSGKPWVFRYKDLRSWWSQLHYNRSGGVEQGSPTSWVPESKPIWFVETGCPAVDKGPNQPNVFYDPKSSESALPHYSGGSRDDLIQRRAIEALLTHWDPTGGLNPTSSVYAGPMIAWDSIHLWTWDARPFPDFPSRSDIWADGDNWRLGHWLNGRAGLAPLSAIAEDLSFRAGLDADASSIEGVLVGYVVDAPISARAALSPLGDVFGFEPTVLDGEVSFVAKSANPQSAIDPNALSVGDSPSRLERVRGDSADLPVEARVRFIDETREYRISAALARGQSTPCPRLMDVAAPVVLDHAAAEHIARGLLVSAEAETETIMLALPPSRSDIQPGDVIAFECGGPHGAYRVRRIEEGGARQALLERCADGVTPTVAGAEPGVFQNTVAPPVRPFGVVMDLPLLPGETERGGPVAAAFASPWPGEVVVAAGADTASVTERARLSSPVAVGELIEALPPGPEGRWDDASRLRIRLSGTSPSSVSDSVVLSGGNMLAVQNASGAWELIQFRDAVLTAADTFDLSRLLRGVNGTELAMGADAGARVVVLARGGTSASVASHERGASLTWRFVSAGLSFSDVNAFEIQSSYDGGDLRPLSPAHLKGRRVAGDVIFNWVRRTRVGGDDWEAGKVPLAEDEERYLVEVLDGPIAVWSAETDVATAIFTSAEEAAVFPDAPRMELNVRVRQYSQTVGWGSSRTENLIL